MGLPFPENFGIFYFAVNLMFYFSNPGPNKVRGLEKIEKLISGGGSVYLAPESTTRNLFTHTCDLKDLHASGLDFLIFQRSYKCLAMTNKVSIELKHHPSLLH